jgi:flavin reductase (DIM6/NTAB) family NADH-FMN oxidoreductase RutF
MDESKSPRQPEQQPDKPLSRPRLRDCWSALKQLSYGVYVVSSRCGEGDSTRVNGMTVRMMTQVSSRPPRVAISVSKTRLTHELICESGLFAVSILSEGQELLGGHFGLRSGRDIHKWLQTDYFNGDQTGAPILNHCSAWLECRVEAVHDMGACSLIVGEVLSGGAQQKKPLVYREEDYFG